jgi:Rps23 Pro-64 3,4-dihydroxylase Tpa1-like proline 4-hydroxylase
MSAEKIAGKRESESAREAKKQREASIFREDLFAQSNIETCASNFASAKPFHWLFFENMFDENFLKQLKQELIQHDYLEKSNDLYQFLQTAKDIKGLEGARLAQLKKQLYGEFREFLEQVIGCKLEGEMDFSIFRYQDSSYLLCHDDDIVSANQQFTRKIAFIIYLVEPDWNEQDGGALELFDSKDGLPLSEPAARVLPKWNCSVFFQVESSRSFHQVAEVLAANKERMSIGGWFHSRLEGDVQRDSTLYDELFRTLKPTVQAPLALADDEQQALLSDWVNPLYLKASIIAQVRQSVAANGSINLTSFIRDANFKAVRESLASLEWQQLGPIHIRNYYVHHGSDGAVAQLLKLTQSRAFVELLGALGGTQLSGYAGELRKFERGNYTLLHDENRSEAALEMLLSFASHDWEELHGGYTVYSDGDDVLLTLTPCGNSLSIVMAQGAMSFVKHVNHHAPETLFDLRCAYWQSE